MGDPSMDREVVARMREQLQVAHPDLLGEMLSTFVQELMGAEAQQLGGAGYGERSRERVSSRNGDRERDWDTRVGTIELALPRLRQGSDFPSWLLAPRRRAERAMVTVIARADLAGVSTRRVEGLVQTLGIERLSKSQVSVMAKGLEGMVEDFRHRPLDGGPSTWVWIDALTQRCREGGRVVNVGTAIASGVNADGYRELLGGLHGRGWRRLDQLPARPGRPWPGRRPPRDLRPPPRPSAGDRGRAAGSRVAAWSGSLRPQPAHPRPQVGVDAGGDSGPLDLRPARPRRRLGSARRDGRATRGALP